MDALIGLHVALRHVGEHAIAGGGIVPPRGIVPAQIAAERVGVGLGKGQDFVRQVAQERDGMLNIVKIAGEVFLALKTAAVLKPGGIGEVVQLDLRVDAALAQHGQLPAIARERRVVKLSLMRLDRCPVDADAVCLYAQRLRQLRVRVPARAVLRGDGRGGVVAHIAEAPPVDPAALLLAALALGGGRGGAQQHILFQCKRLHCDPSCTVIPMES